MSYSYRLSQRAQTHFREATIWYYDQSPKAAEDFSNCIEECLNFLCQNIYIQRQTYRQFSHYYLKKYPYTIIYTVDQIKKLVIIRAIYHQKRSPRNKYR